MRPPRLLSLNPTPRLPLRHLSIPHPLHLSTTPLPPPVLTTHDIPAPHLGLIRILTLNSPRNRNAFSTTLLSSLTHEITTLSILGDGSRGGVRALIIASALDNVFCAGADLKERKTMSDTEYAPLPPTFPTHIRHSANLPLSNRTTHFLSSLRATFHTLASLPIPTLSAISSVALGGGFELALATTFRVCAADAVLGLPETRLGIVPGAGGTWRLRRLVGEARALEMVLTGRRIDGRVAEGWGVCERVVEGGGGGGDMGEGEGGKGGEAERRRCVLAGAVQMAREICEGAPVSVGAGMRAVRGGGGIVMRR